VLISSFSQSAISPRFIFWIWVKCLYNKQNNTWTLGDMNLSSCACSSLLRSLVRYLAWTLEDKFHISARPCIIFYFIIFSSLALIACETTLFKFILVGMCSLLTEEDWKCQASQIFSLLNWNNRFGGFVLL
jgi:hypothetical protein